MVSNVYRDEYVYFLESCITRSAISYNPPSPTQSKTSNIPPKSKQQG